MNNPLRVFFAWFYFLFSLILVSSFSGFIFYSYEKSGLDNIGRFIWCLCCTMLGFAGIAFHWRKLMESPLPDYVTIYPVQLLVISALIYSVLHLFENTSGYLFYYLSFSLCVTMGYLVDSYFKLFVSIAEKAKDKASNP